MNQEDNQAANKEASEEDSLMEFPCSFPIKAMGIATDDFDMLIVGIVRKHYPDVSEGAVKTRPSREGKYISVTVTIEAQSREQLDNIYLELTAHERVLMAF
jgi:putative lipoic acid-binding regulatory protein